MLILFRADKSSAIYRSLENFSNSIVSTGKVVSMPHLETGAILIDATEMFLTDVSYVSQNRKGQYRFDKKIVSLVISIISDKYRNTDEITF